MKYICEYTDENQTEGYIAQPVESEADPVHFDTFAEMMQFGESPDIELVLIRADL